MRKYFLHDGEKELGVYTFEEISKLELLAQYHVWYDGLAEWQPIETIEELKPLIKSPSPIVETITEAVIQPERIAPEPAVTATAVIAKNSTKQTQTTSAPEPAIKDISNSEVRKFIYFLIFIAIAIIYNFRLEIKDILMPETKFSFFTVSKMADKGMKFTENICKENDYNVAIENVYVKDSLINTIVKYQGRNEEIRTFSSSPYKVEYALKLEKAYEKFLEVVHSQAYTPPTEERIKGYDNNFQYKYENIVFIVMGYNEIEKRYVITAVKGK